MSVLDVGYARSEVDCARNESVAPGAVNRMTTMSRSLSGPTVDVNDHLAAAAYLMKRHGPSPLAVVNGHRPGCWPEGVLTATDLARAAADGVDFEHTRVGQFISELRGAALTWDTPLKGDSRQPCLSLVISRPDAVSVPERIA